MAQNAPQGCALKVKKILTIYAMDEEMLFYTTSSANFMSQCYLNSSSISIQAMADAVISNNVIDRHGA